MSTTTDSVAVVAGGSRGIGRATAEALRQHGYLVATLSRCGGSGEYDYCCDIRDAKDVFDVIARVRSEHGEIRVLVNSAGIATTTPSLEITPQEWDGIFATNARGTFLTCQAVLPGMIEAKRGRIINIASIAARSYSRSASVAYTASKCAVVGLTRQLAAEHARNGITINCVAPSQTETPMVSELLTEAQRRDVAGQTGVGRLAFPDEIAQVICFLASDRSSYVNGSVLDVDGGPRR